MAIKSWDALRKLRHAGQKPSLPVIITNLPHLPRRFDGVGCMVILHESGEPMPVNLLSELNVIWFFDACHIARFAYELTQKRGVKLASSRAWCACAFALGAASTYCSEQQCITGEWVPHAA